MAETLRISKGAVNVRRSTDPRRLHVTVRDARMGFKFQISNRHSRTILTTASEFGLPGSSAGQRSAPGPEVFDSTHPTQFIHTAS
jgi:hypothetical protein